MMLSEQLKGEAEKWREILVRILDTLHSLGRDSSSGRHKAWQFFMYPGTYRTLRSNITRMSDQGQTVTRRSLKVTSTLFVSRMPELICTVLCRMCVLCNYCGCDSQFSSKEQTVFILRYLKLCTKHDQPCYKDHERFLSFVDCSSKTGKAIAELVRSTLTKHDISMSGCRGQGYDNGANKGARRTEAAESCPEDITFFGPQCWKILQNAIGCSLHKLSYTRWSARVGCVKPFAAHLPGMMKAVEDVKSPNLTADTILDVKGIENCINSFEGVLMSFIWIKTLTQINYINMYAGKGNY
ncbi:hypothetical protein PR048_004048 [Dryococelus australis]|uniref:Uncharacterized protein n=1 Tax=Dryococelus australis TaxID=614101 RepID=A0ABQ9I5F4_9NEOP|nr:hypothetical protein PR048_004048 [Dryococelus australis]